LKRLVLFLLILLIAIDSQAQRDSIPINDTSSVFKKKKHSALKASLLSTALPGLGQAYNRRYWKIPIVWAGLAGLGYGIISNNINYNEAREAYLSRVNDNDPSNDVPYRNLSLTQIQTVKNNYKSSMDMFSILTIVWYGLNIVDATVDGHLFSFDVSNDLSLNMQPNMLAYQQQAYCGISIQLKIKN
jgi:hypothetical protein